MEGEEIKKPIQFGVVSSPNKEVKETLPSKKKVKEIVGIDLSNANFEKIKLKHGVTIVLAKDIEEDYTKLQSLADVIELDKRKPNLVAGFIPALYNEFVNREDMSIKTYVVVDNMVLVKRKFMDSKGDTPRRVIELYLKSLNNMTVVIAVLDDKDMYLANQLELFK